ncbi:hypothetical protein ACFVT8_22795, partial [Lysinibacillus sp. NPDC058147]|uniref:hypothetical protein n=1 Tax=Lysinibacillus sp. NPDC058147 TaxID=3346357 RepID=UPI0036DF1E79
MGISDLEERRLKASRPVITPSCWPKRLIGRAQKALLCAKAKRQRQLFYLRESEASAAIVLSARKRSVSGNCFICAKAKRQRQLFYLRESEASAAIVLSARKR